MDGLIATNTTIHRNSSHNSLIRETDGGLSGELLYEKSNEVLKDIANNISHNLLIIGAGGAGSAAAIEAKKNNVKKYLNILSLNNKYKNLVETCSIELKGINLARDLINLPANYLNPDQYEIEIKKIFKSLKCVIHKGRNFDKEFPLISMVGRSSEFNPKLIEINWKNKDVKKDKNNVTIIGKGITFDRL